MNTPNGGDFRTGTITGPQRNFPVKNTEYESIPPYSVIEIVGASRPDSSLRAYVEAGKPTGDAEKVFAFTGPMSILAQDRSDLNQGYGSATMDGPMWAAYDETDGTPQTGDIYTVQKDSWVIHPGGNEFVVIGAAVSDESPPRVLIMPASALRTRVSQPPSGGCCAACVPCEWMTVDGFYAEDYESLGAWPDQLGGPDLTWSYIGLNADNNYVWQTDAFEFACDDGTDSYYLELVVYADGTSECKSEGSEVAEIYLCNDATATECEDLTAQNCTGGCADGATGGGGGALDCACPCDVWVVPSASGMVANSVPYKPGDAHGCYRVNAADDLGATTDSDGNFIHFYGVFDFAAGTLTIAGTKDSDGGAFSVVWTAASSPLPCTADTYTFTKTSQTGSIATQPSSITVTVTTGNPCP